MNKFAETTKFFTKLRLKSNTQLLGDNVMLRTDIHKNKTDTSGLITVVNVKAAQEAIQEKAIDGSSFEVMMVGPDVDVNLLRIGDRVILNPHSVPTGIYSLVNKETTNAKGDTVIEDEEVVLIYSSSQFMFIEKHS